MTSTAELVTESVADLNKNVNEKRTFMQLGFKEKLSYTREIITVEPLIAAYLMAATLCQPALRVLELEKACRANFQYEQDVCDAILTSQHQNYSTENSRVIKLVNDIHSWQVPLQSVMPLILVLFLGSYSDRQRWRKPFLILPIFGELFSILGCTLCVVFMDTWPVEVQGVFQLIIPSFFGGYTMLIMAVFAYIADVSTLEMRTLRVGIVQIVIYVTTPVTTSFAAHLYAIGYYGVLLMGAGLYAFAILYGIFCIKEPRQKVVSTAKNVCYDIFNPSHAVDTFSLILKKKDGVNRLYVWMVLLTLLIYNVVAGGEGDVFFYYVQKEFYWNLVDFNNLLTVNTLVHLVGAAVAVPLFTKVLNLTDLSILLITFLDKIISNVVFLIANTSYLIYAGVVVSIITGVTQIGIRSLATKIVTENDLGKAQSLFGICEAIAIAIAPPIYNKGLFNSTLDTFPRAFFLFGLLLYGLWCFVLGWMLIREKIKSRKNVDGNMNGVELKTVPTERYVETTHI